jgi:hypothetical protein
LNSLTLKKESRGLGGDVADSIGPLDRLLDGLGDEIGDLAGARTGIDHRHPDVDRVELGILAARQLDEAIDAVDQHRHDREDPDAVVLDDVGRDAEALGASCRSGGALAVRLAHRAEPSADEEGPAAR